MTESTIVSIVPVEIVVNKSGAVYPGNWVIPQADDLKPKTLIIRDGWTRIYLGVERGYFKTPILSAELAQSVVNDYVRSCIGFGDNCQPGIFSVSDKVITNPEKECAEQLNIARVQQNNWYDKLIMDADNDWSRSGHSHRTISDLQRLIARKRRLDKEWLHTNPNDTPSGMIKCPACQSDIESKSIVCKHCHLVLKPEEHKKLVFA